MPKDIWKSAEDWEHVQRAHRLHLLFGYPDSGQGPKSTWKAIPGVRETLIAYREEWERLNRKQLLLESKASRESRSKKVDQAKRSAAKRQKAYHQQGKQNEQTSVKSLLGLSAAFTSEDLEELSRLARRLAANLSKGGLSDSEIQEVETAADAMTDGIDMEDYL